MTPTELRCATKATREAAKAFIPPCPESPIPEVDYNTWVSTPASPSELSQTTTAYTYEDEETFSNFDSLPSHSPTKPRHPASAVSSARPTETFPPHNGLISDLSVDSGMDMEARFEYLPEQPSTYMASPITLSDLLSTPPPHPRNAQPGSHSSSSSSGGSSWSAMPPTPDTPTFSNLVQLNQVPRSETNSTKASYAHYYGLYSDWADGESHESMDISPCPSILFTPTLGQPVIIEAC